MRDREKKFEGLWRAKWTTDGSETIAEMSAKLRAQADYLDEMAAAGVVLSHEVGDDYAFLETNDPAVAEKYGFHEEDNDDEDECDDEDCATCRADPAAG